jgi:hypothetical protein
VQAYRARVKMIKRKPQILCRPQPHHPAAFQIHLTLCESIGPILRIGRYIARRARVFMDLQATEALFPQTARILPVTKNEAIARNICLNFNFTDSVYAGLDKVLEFEGDRHRLLKIGN